MPTSIDGLDLDTFAGWTGQQRSVITGQRANYYGRTESGIWIALFNRDQTQEAPCFTISDMVEIQTTAEHKGTPPEGKKRPKAIVEFDAGYVQVWVGNSKKGIGMVKKNHYRFDPQRHRWIAKRDDPQKVVDGLTTMGFNVDVRIPEQAVA